MPIRLVALDIDGTLMNAATGLSEANRRAVREACAHGVAVVLATGRIIDATRPIWEELGLEGPMITYGGAWIVEAPSAETLWIDRMDPELVRECVRLADGMGIHVHLYQDDTVVYRTENDFVRRYVGRHSLKNRQDPGLADNLYERVPKVLAYADPAAEEPYRKAFEKALQGKAFVSRSIPGFIEISGLEATKGQALARVARMLGIPREETAAVGDNYLDADMLSWAGTGVAVANAEQEILELSDLTVPSCADNGVAWFIENYVL